MVLAAAVAVAIAATVAVLVALTIVAVTIVVALALVALVVATTRHSCEAVAPALVYRLARRRLLEEVKVAISEMRHRGGYFHLACRCSHRHHRQFQEQ